MDNLDFCHLHNHSFFSLLDGVPHPKDYVEYAKELGFKHIGLTDHGSISGLIKFQNSCIKNDIHPVLGMEGYIVPNMTVREKGYGHINFFIKNAKGYKTLLNFMTVSNKVGFYYKPRMDFDLLLNSDLDGLIITTACAGSFLNLAGGEEFFNKLNDKIGDNLLIEIMPHRIESQSKVHEKINRLLNSSIILEDRLIATNDCHYCKDGDEFAQDVLLAINRRAKWDDPKRFSFGFNGLYLRTANEMINEFKNQGDFTDDIINKAMLNTVNIAERCNFTIPKKEISLPRIPMVVKDNLNEEELVLDICEKGYKKLIGEYNKEYVDRLEFEFSVIKEKKFLRYFLLLWDIIEHCKKNNIPYGPGRGSAAGSLMSYLMGITKVDPIKYGLFFERFIDLEREDYPDIDVDFGDKERYKVKEYLEKTYGENRVCAVPTFITIADKGAIKDVCRVFDIDLKEVNIFTKGIPDKIDLKDYIKDNKYGREFYRKYPKEVDMAIKLNGTIKSYGKHASALIVSGEDLLNSDMTCLQTINKVQSSCWDMEDSEHNGLMKLDTLSLNTLTVTNDCVNKINLDIDNIPLDDKDVFNMLSDGNTAGVFQFSSPSFTDYVLDLKINDLNDIFVCSALVRPGPRDSGMDYDYVDRKYGKIWEKSHPIYEDITKDTFGIMCYQEQTMQVISRLAGLPFSVADKVRKVIGKKRDASEFEPYRIQFIEGCKKEQTFTEEEANKFWSDLLNWASYGFNMSHSVSYGIISYQTAWLKYHYTDEFITSFLTYGNNKIRVINEAKAIGYKFLPPKIKVSKPYEWVLKGEVFYAPFSFIKGISKEAQSIYDKAHTETFGFFEEFDDAAKGKTEELLRTIGAYDRNAIPYGINDYLELEIF